MKKLLKTFSITLLISVLFPAVIFAGFRPADVGTIAGSGEFSSLDGKSLEAGFRIPSFITEGSDGTIYISDTSNHLIRKLTNGQVSTVTGTTTEKDEYGMPLGGFKDGSKKEAMFNSPKGIALGSNGTLYVVDSGNNAIRVVDKDGNVSTLVKGLNDPTDIVAGKNGDLYVTDTMNHRVVKISAAGALTVVAGGNYQKDGEFLVGAFLDGAGTNAKFNEPAGIVMDAKGNLIVADAGNQRIRKIDATGNVVTIAGKGTEKIEGTNYVKGDYVDGAAKDAMFNFPGGVDVDASGNIYVADTFNFVVRVISSDYQRVETAAGAGESGLENGYDKKALFAGPSDIEILSNGNIAVADHYNNKIRIIDWTELPARPNDPIAILLNNKYVIFKDVKPKLVNSRTMIPVRALSEEMGYQVGWDKVKQEVSLTKDNKTIILTIGKKDVVGVPDINLDTAPYIDNGRTMVPIRFVMEAYNKQVDWMQESRTVVIR